MNGILYFKNAILKKNKYKKPHFELLFNPTQKVFGVEQIDNRDYSSWNKMTKEEKSLERKKIAKYYVDIASKYNHSAIYIRSNPRIAEETMYIINEIRELSGLNYYIIRGGDATFGIPDSKSIMWIIDMMLEHKNELHDIAKKMVDDALDRSYKIGYVNGICLSSDYCTNKGSFFSKDQFEEFILPYMKKLVSEYHKIGFDVIKHTDGNIMPILDMMVSTGIDAIHSLDPQAGVDIAIVKKKYPKLCLIGNVKSSLLEIGTDKEFEESVNYALKYCDIFSTSSSIYSEKCLTRYEKMIEMWNKYNKKFGEPK